MTKRSDRSFRASLKVQQHQQNSEKSARRKKLQSAKKKLKRSHQPKRARRKNWLPANDNWDDLDYAQEERVMPRDERDRRRALEQAAFKKSQSEAAEVEPPAPNNADTQGLVVEVSQGLCRVELEQQPLLCRIRGALQAEEITFTNVVAVGDQVLVSHNGSEEGLVEAVLPRRSVLARPDVFRSHLQQAIVANVDQILIVASWREPIIWLELIDRYLIAAERNNLPAIICVNKSDLIEDEADCQATLQPYQAVGYPVIRTSALTGAGIDNLRTTLQNRMTVLAGLSGVGKSSLLTAVQPDLQLRTGVVSDHSGEGRHTTTQATLIHLDAETAVVDTPGIREFGLSGLHQRDLANFFPEIAALAPRCRFADCTHLNEPNCAVQAAQAQGTVAHSRYDSYQKIYETLPA